MPWKQREIFDMRSEAVTQALNHEKSKADICRFFNISRPTLDKWIRRYQEEGASGLHDCSRRPHSQPKRTSETHTDLILATRAKFLCWGAKKLREFLINEGETDLPSTSTFNRVLKRHHKITSEASSKSQKFVRFEREEPMELLQMDFKGHFSLEEGRCHPLTVIDDHSRYVLCLQGCLSENRESVQDALTAVFRTYGLPKQMTMDNGPPWKGAHPFRLSRLTVWLIRLGIDVRHSRPYHPQTQGKDERFHRSLKEEVLKLNQFRDLYEAQLAFDEWLEVYNTLRPHEGIGMKRPVDLFRPSDREFPEKLPTIEYGEGDEVRKVTSCGTINYNGKRYYVGEHLIGEYVAVRPTTRKDALGIFFFNSIVGWVPLTGQKITGNM